MRGIATGTSFHKLVAKSLARQFGEEAERVLRPIPVRAVHTAARTVILGPRCCPSTVWELTTIFAQRNVGQDLRGGKPPRSVAVRSGTYAQPSCNHWQDEHNRVRQIRQLEEGARRSIDATAVLFSSAQCVDGWCKNSSLPENKSSHTWMTSTRCQRQSGHLRSTSCRKKLCLPQ